MIKYLIFIISIAIAQEFLLDQNFGTVIIDDNTYDKPFLGGFNKPKVQWIDWDEDQDDDLFLLDEDGHIKFFENKLLESSEFELISTNFFELSNISWFFIGDFDDDNEYEIITQNPDDIDQMLYYDIVNSSVIEIGTVYDVMMNPVESDGVMNPTFVDIDNDEDLDFFTGNVVGTVTYYENVGFNNDIPQFELMTNFWEDIYIVGSSFERHGASAIKFIDIDQDLDYDLAWGDFFQQSLYIITNEGTVDTPNMDNENIISQFPENSPIITAGLNMPSFTDIDGDLDSDLFITVLSGAYGYQLVNNFYYYNNNDGEYELITQEFIKTVDLFSDICPEFVDIDNDNDIDLFIGIDVDLSTAPWSGKIKYFENIGSNENGPIWMLNDPEYIDPEIGNNLSLDFGDIDNDNDFDLVIGDFNGLVKLYLNIGSSNNPIFDYEENILEIDLPGYSIPKLVDIDSDDDLDLFIGQINGTISFYRNIGSASSYIFSFETNNYQNISVGSRSSIEFFDIDNDNDFDLLIGSSFDGVVIFKNIGSTQEASFVLNHEIEFPVVCLNSIPAMYVDNEELQLVIGCSTGGAYALKYEVCGLIGDFNNDFIVDIIDIVFLIATIFETNTYDSDCQLDLNDDSMIDVLDILIVVNIIIN